MNAKELMDEAVADATIDGVMRRDPASLKFPEDYVPLIEALRTKRAMFIEGEGKKKAKKEGVEEDD